MSLICLPISSAAGRGTGIFRGQGKALVPFKARIDGKPEVSLDFSRDRWIELKKRVGDDPGIALCVCCPVPAEVIPKISRLQRFFFAHRTAPVECMWVPESPEHLEMKLAVRDAVLAMDGWSAEVEVPGNGWKADVLATKGDFRIAFEVQLSQQGQARTWLREGRYEDAEVLPWWIVTSTRNVGDGFGSDLRSVVTGSDLKGVLASTAREARKVIERIESQVAIARELYLLLREKGIAYRPMRFGRLPVGAALELGKTQGQEDGVSEQIVVIGELGAGVIQDHEQLCASSAANPWGSVAQFVRLSPPVKGYRSIAFRIRGESERFLRDRLDRLLDGRLRWDPSVKNVERPAALVWYPEKCGGCGQAFARAPFAIQDHVYDDGTERMLAVFDTEDSKPWKIEAVRRFEARTGLRLGKILEGWFRRPTEVARQNCPHCGKYHTEALVTWMQAQAAWPYTDIDWTFIGKAKGSGSWTVPSMVKRRRSPPSVVWNGIVDAAKAARREGREKARLEKIERDRVAEERARERKKKLEEEAEKALRDAEVAAAAAKVKADELAKWNAFRKTQGDIAAREALLERATSAFGRKDMAEVWMNTTSPILGGRPAELCTADSLDMCVAALPKLKRA